MISTKNRRHLVRLGSIRSLIRRTPLPLHSESEDVPRDALGAEDSLRISDHGVSRGAQLTFWFDDNELVAYEGESIAAATLAHAIRSLRLTARNAEPRGVYCGMGVCFECLVTVDGWPNHRACLTGVASGMRVHSQSSWSLESPRD